MKKYLLILFLLAGAFIWADWQIDEGFESGSIPADWTIYNGEQGSTWSAFENSGYAYGGNWSAFTDSYYPEDEENWLILPQTEISEGDSLLLYVRSWYSVENFEILVSLDTNAINDFDDELISVEGQDDEYTLYQFDLSEYAGENIYIGLHWLCETYGLLIDNVKLGQGTGDVPEIDLPESFSFTQGEQLNVDLSEYITNAEPETATLTASGNEHIEIVIDGFNVSFSSLIWNGSEDVTFILEDNSGYQVSDNVQVIVEAADIYDIKLLSVNEPGFLTCLDESITPGGVLINNGTLASGELSLEVNCQIFDEAANEVYSSNQEIEFSLAPGETVTFELSESWTAEAEGEYTALFFYELEDASIENNSLESTTMVREHFGSGGPDDFGYHWLDNHTAQGPEYNWIDISETGESAITYNVPSFEGDDNFSEFIPFGFDFNFYGIDYSEFSVDVNGEILLADNSWHSAYPSNGWGNDGNVFNWAYPIPGYSQMPALIAVYWDDLEADEGIGDVYFQTFGEAPERYCVIQWHDLRFHTGDGLEDYLNFEVIITESGELTMQYAGTATGQTGSNAPHDHGQSATVAIQNEAGDMGMTYLQEQVEGSTWVGVEPAGNILTDGLAIRFFAGEDNYPPFISHEQRGNSLLTELELQATITDMSGLSEDHLVYNDGSGWIEVEHSDFEEPNIYTYTLTGLEPGQEIHYYFQAIDNSEANNEGTSPADAPEECYSFRVLPYSDNNVLLAYSGNQDYTGAELEVWQDALENGDLQYDLYNWQEWSDVDIPSQYEAVYLYSNSCSHTEELDSLCVALMDWLDSGIETAPKNLFFASDGFAYSQSGHSNDSPMKKLLNGYFRTAYVGTAIGGGTNGLGGPGNVLYQDGSFQVWENSPIGESGDEIAVYANSPDCIFRYEACPSWYEDEVINPEIGSANAFVFEDGPFNGQAYLYHGVCGTWIDNLIYKAFFFSFDLSQITSSNDRNGLIGDCNDWFDIEISEASDQLVPAVNRLHQNYPNPFIMNGSRNSTMISFTCKDAETAELCIYDIRGRKLNTMSKDIRGMIDSSFIWDGYDKSGKEAGSGVYFYQLKLDGFFVDARKMLLLH